MKEKIRDRMENYLAREYGCGTAEWNGSGTFFTTHVKKGRLYLKIMAYRNRVAVCTSPELREKTQRLLRGKNRDEIFEMPFVYGQTIHFVPDGRNAAVREDLPLKEGYGLAFLFGKEVLRLQGLAGFENSVVFHEGVTPAEAAVVVRKNRETIGAAGAARTATEGVWEVGVDVREGHRNAGLAAAMVSRLTRELLIRDIVPFYSASVTNIGSQMVASRCGYLPFWVDTFGTTLDGSSVYDEIVSVLRF